MAQPIQPLSDDTVTAYGELAVAVNALIVAVNSLQTPATT